MTNLDINTEVERFQFVPKRFEVELGFHIIRKCMHSGILQAVKIKLVSSAYILVVAKSIMFSRKIIDVYQKQTKYRLTYPRQCL